MPNALAENGPDVSIGAPGGITVDSQDNVYFSSPNLVYKLTPQLTLTRVAGSAQPGFAGDGGPAKDALLNFPETYPELARDPIDFYSFVAGLAVDNAGSLYIADAYNGRVRKVDRSGVITSVATTAPGGNELDTGFGWPQGVGVDAEGNLYVSSQWGEIYKITAAGVRSTIATWNCGQGFAGPGICVPEQIAVDGTGNVFVGDTYCRVRKVGPDGSIVTIAGDERPSTYFTFTCGYYGDGGPADRAALGSLPYGVAVDGSGNVFIADTGNDCVRKVNAAGIISTLAGTCMRGGYGGDGGPANKALLLFPSGVAVDSHGAVYVADTGNHRVRKISPDGTIVTVAGNGGLVPQLVQAEAFAPAVAIGPGFTGAWYDPAQSGHGLIVEVLPDNRFLAAWFTFAPNGDQAWFYGVGTYSGNTATVTAVDQPSGGRWIPNFDPKTIVHNPWGTLTFTFTDCSHGRVDFVSTPGYGTGSMSLTRLTQLAGLTCQS